MYLNQANVDTLKFFTVKACDALKEIQELRQNCRKSVDGGLAPEKTIRIARLESQLDDALLSMLETVARIVLTRKGKRKDAHKDNHNDATRGELILLKTQKE